MSRILLVDDDRELLTMAAALLVHAQFDVVCCQSVTEALEQVRSQEFDVIVTDANMSPHTGYDLIRSVKLLPNYDLIPIAMLTGRREKRDVERALALGAEDYIVKPLDPENFIKKVKELVVRSEEHRRISKFAEIAVDEVATCELPLIVTSLTEAGVALDSDHSLHVGSQIRLSSEIFNRIGISNPNLRVTSCVAGAFEGAFEIRAAFYGLDEKQVQKVRQFVQASALQTKRSQKAS